MDAQGGACVPHAPPRSANEDDVQDCVVKKKLTRNELNRIENERRKKLREEQKNGKDRQAFDDVISMSKAAERNAEELKRSSKNKPDSREILQNDLRRDFDKEKPRIEIRNSEGQIRTTDVAERLQGQCVVGKLSGRAEKRKITPEKEPGTFCIIVLKAFFLL